MIVSTMSAAKSGQGTCMYSRAGKSTISQYMCFNDKSEDNPRMKILNNKENKEKEIEVIWDVSLIDKNIVPFAVDNADFKQDTQTDLSAANSPLNNKKQRSKKQKGLSFSFMSIERGDSYDLKFQSKRKCPATGHYNPSFHFVERKIAGFKFKYGEPTKARHSQTRKKSKKKSPKDFETRIGQLNESQENPLLQSQDDISPFQTPERKPQSASPTKHVMYSNPTTSLLRSKIDSSPHMKNRNKLKLFSSNYSSKERAKFISRPMTSMEKNRTYATSYADWKNPFSYSPEPPKLHLKSAIDFNKQMTRSPIADPKKPPNEKRFAYYESPCKVIGHYKQFSPPNFKKVLPRKNIFNIKKELYLQDYEANTEIVKPSLTLGLVKFDKVTSRPSPEIRRRFNIPECYPQDKIREAYSNQSHIIRVKTPSMAKMLPRDNKMYNLNEGYNLKNEDKIKKQMWQFRSVTPSVEQSNYQSKPNQSFSQSMNQWKAQSNQCSYQSLRKKQSLNLSFL